MQDSHTAGADRAAYYARIAKKHMAPLWESLHNLVPREPARAACPPSGSTRTCAPTSWPPAR